MTVDLEQHWTELLDSVQLSSHSTTAAFEQIIKAYQEPQRVYHTLAHLQHFIDELQSLPQIQAQTWFALYYHDIVYKPGSKSNEKKSADIATKHMQSWGMSSTFTDRVSQLILATKTHKVEVDDTEACLFLDADMAILGSSQPVYLEYADAIRKEHRMYPDFLYNKGRKTFLKQTLASERLYLSDHFYRLYEQQARDNIATELNTLG